MIKLLFLITLFPHGMVSKYLSEKEAFHSEGHPAIVCTPSQRQKEVVQRFGFEYFDSLRIAAASPLYVSSMYRCSELNQAVGGARNSDHMINDDVVACDIDQDGRGKINNTALFYLIRSRGGFYKIIWEFGTYDSTRPMNSKYSKGAWVHISWSTNPVKNKMNKVYRAIKVGGKTVYRVF